MNLSRYDINDRLTAMAQDFGIDTADERFDDDLDDLTHIVAFALARHWERQHTA